MPEFDVKQRGVPGTGPRQVPNDKTIRELWSDLKRDLKHDLKNLDEQPLPRWCRGAEPVIGYLDKRLGAGFWSVVGIVVVGFVLGTPHMLTTYECSGSCRSPSAWESNCRYIGITGSTIVNPPDGECPGFTLL